MSETDFTQELDDFVADIKGTPVDLDSNDIHQVAETIESLAHASKSRDFSLVYSLLEYLLFIFGMDVLPVLKVAGMESVGKSALVEAFASLPISYSALGRATVAPVFYFIQKNLRLDQTYKCTIRLKGKPEEPIDIQSVGKRIMDIQLDIKKRLKYSMDPIVVKIQVNSSYAESVTIIDLPGVIKADSEENDEATVNGLRNITFATLKHNSDKDIILLLQELASNPSHFELAKEIQVNIPSARYVIPVATRADVALTNKDYKDEPKNLLQQVKAIRNVNKNTTPFLISLFKWTEATKGYDVEEKITHMINNIKDSSQLILKYLEEMHSQIPDQSDKQFVEEMTSKATFDALKHHVAKIKMEALKKACNSIPKKFRSLLETRKTEMAELAKCLEANEAAKPLLLLQSFCFDYFHVFLSLYTGQMAQEADKVIYKERLLFNLEKERKLAEDLGAPVEWPPEEIEEYTLKERNSMKDIFKYVQDATMNLAIGYQRVERLISEMRLLVTGIEIQEPSNEFLKNNASATPAAVISDFNAAVGQLASKVSISLLVDSGSMYLKTRLKAILYSHADVAWSILKKNPQFHCLQEDSIRNILQKLVDKLVEASIESLEKPSRLMFSYVRVEDPCFTEKRANFIYGRNQDNTFKINPTWRGDAREDPTIGSEKLERYDKEARTGYLSNGTLVGTDEVVNAAVQNVGEHIYDHARYLFSRIFSVFRERFGQDLIPGLLLGAVNENIMGSRTVPKNHLHKMLSNLILVDPETGQVRTDEELKRAFTTPDNYEYNLESYKKLQKEVESLELILNQLNIVKNALE